ncbi:hypothetical protein AQUCO_00200134v1 [Aquilegia coerulea]|uniref:Type 2 DNA topoisomerase 6 subunit B-like n=1 Tax=Aquilegia coerulea TaxID=218851 RepID=A0A2G5F1T4_AQUCA|nr:hypothetical protein AQUCO_00200134v1 [Aquilegia coerulea]PIA61930.1 hypothetical protein AQUCO_00200134v1 [Aquilegia coerulea]
MGRSAFYQNNKCAGICENEVYEYRLNFKEKVPARRLKKLPPTSKNGAKFSGTEASLSTYESIDVLCAGIIHFLQKMHMLKIPKMAVELMVERSSNTGSKCENLFQANEGIHLLFSISNIQRLVSGLEDHVLKHGNALDRECQSCFSSREHLKLGVGTSPNSEGPRNNGQIIEAVIVITELPEPPCPSCLRVFCCSTEVFYFQDFLPSTIPQSLANAVTSMDWKSYGLSLKSNVVGEDGQLVLEWENLPPYSHIDIAIHCYHNQYPTQMRQKIHFDRNLLKKAVKLAMDDLKEKYAGILLSAHAIKIQNYAPDLARTIAGLILSSNDTKFQGECISLLGLPPQDMDKEKVEDCIKGKITAVIRTNDRKPQRKREAAPFLFEDESNEAEYLDEDEDDEEYDTMDIVFCKGLFHV